MQQIAPDGKIYIECPGTTMAMHIINNPDSAGVACDVQQHAILLPHFNATIPNFPNYNLGRLIGSPCDTLQWTGVHEQVNDFRFRIFPNPNDGNFKISYQLPHTSTGSVSASGVLQIIDVTGKTVYKQNLPQWSTMQNISLPLLADGVYNCVITSDGMRVSKMVVVIKE